MARSADCQSATAVGLRRTDSPRSGRVARSRSRTPRVGDSNPAVLFTWLSAGWRNVSTDLPPSTLLDLALTATQVKPGNVNNLVVPGRAGSAGAASVVFVSSSAHSLFADMRKDGLAGR